MINKRVPFMKLLNFHSLKRLAVAFVLILVSSLLIKGCGGSTSTSAGDGGSGITSCTLTDNTTETSQSSNGCYLLTRDTTSCQASRTAQGLSGFWLKFSCRVTLTKNGSDVIITTDG